MDARLWKNLDVSLIVLVVLLSLFGLVAIGSASQASLHNPATWVWVRQQALWIVIGLVAMMIVAAVDYHALARWGNLLYILNVGMLALVLVLGHHALGAQRWLQFGPVSLQPSEVAKVLLIVTLAIHLAPRVGEIRTWRDAVAPAVHVLVPTLLVVLQPDLGSSLVFVAILVGMLYVAGMPGWRLSAAVVGVLALAVAGIILHLRFHLPFPLREYQLQRLIVFTNPQSDPLGAGYHILQSEIAIGSGQAVGQGIFGATLSRFAYLPEARTDFIFAVVGQTVGFVGSLALIGAFFLLLWRGLHIAAHARDALGALLAGGVVSLLAFHIIVNAGMTMGLMPVTGVPLPFVSYGGTAILTDFTCIGLLLSVHRRRKKIQF